MTDSMRKRKYAGMTVQEKRRLGVGKEVPTEKKPPHLRERQWVLRVEWTETRVYKGEKKYVSRAARDEGRRRLAKDIEKETLRRKSKYYGSWGYDNAYFYDFEATTRIVGEPTYIESIEES